MNKLSKEYLIHIANPSTHEKTKKEIGAK